MEQAFMVENSITWLLVADASKARIYAMHKARIFQEPQPGNGHDNLTLVSEFSHEASRKKDSDLANSATYEFTSPKSQEAEKFAQELLKQIKDGHQEKIFRDVILVAPPTFMGLLCKHMHTDIEKLVSQRIEKDYTHNNEKELLHNLLNHF